MYAVAERLDPDTYFALARATYREMVAAGITTVGEFHYLHHQPDGTPYDEPERDGPRAARGRARGRDPDRAAGHLLPQQRVRRSRPRACSVRYSDGDAEAWAARAERRPGGDPLGAGGAARPARRSSTAGRRCTCTSPSRSPRTRPASRRTASPRPGCCTRRTLLGPDTTVVHATHLTDDDIELLGTTGTNVCITPDHRARPRRRHRARRAGCTTPAAGSRSAATATRSSTCSRRCAAWRWTSGWPPSERGHWTGGRAARRGTGHDSLGFADAGAIAVGAARRPGHPRHDQPADRGHRRRRAHRGVRGHRRRRHRRWSPTAGSSSRAGDDEEIGRELDARDRSAVATHR